MIAESYLSPGFVLAMLGAGLLAVLCLIALPLGALVYARKKKSRAAAWIALAWSCLLVPLAAIGVLMFSEPGHNRLIPFLCWALLPALMIWRAAVRLRALKSFPVERTS